MSRSESIAAALRLVRNSFHKRLTGNSHTGYIECWPLDDLTAATVKADPFQMDPEDTITRLAPDSVRALKIGDLLIEPLTKDVWRVVKIDVSQGIPFLWHIQDTGGKLSKPVPLSIWDMQQAELQLYPLRCTCGLDASGAGGNHSEWCDKAHV